MMHTAILHRASPNVLAVPAGRVRWPSPLLAGGLGLGAGGPSEPRGSAPATEWGIGAAASPRPRIVVVEDEALIALDLERRLARMGFDVVGVADNAADALELCRAERPALVLMDIFIRGPRDGIQAAAELRRLDDVPVVFLTAYADADTMRRAAEVCAYGHVTKPFDERVLRETICAALDRHRDERERGGRA